MPALWRPALSARFFFVSALCGFALCGCGTSTRPYGFVEIKVLPGLTIDSWLQLGKDKFKVSADAPTVLHEPVGHQLLKVKDGDIESPVCSFIIRRDKVTTVTLVTAGDELKCQVQDPGPQEASD